MRAEAAELVVVAAAGELAVVVVVVADFVVAGEVEVAVDFVAGDGEVFAEVWAKPTTGRAARRASARIERNGFIGMELSILMFRRSSSGIRD